MTHGPDISRRALIAGAALLSVPALVRPATVAPAPPAVTEAFDPGPTARGITCSLQPESTVRGVVPINVRVDPARGIPVGVTIQLGPSRREMWLVGDTWHAEDWDTTRKLADPASASPSNFCAWVTVTVDFGSHSISTEEFAVFTGNYDYPSTTTPVWRDSLGWRADYSSYAAWLSSYDARIVGRSYADLVPDPDRPSSRRAVAVSLPDTARLDSDQPTSSPRFQAAQPLVDGAGIGEGDAFYVGFSVYVPTVDSSAPDAGGFPAVDLSDPGTTNRHVAIFQLYGPQARTPSNFPSGRGAALIIDAQRASADDPRDRFRIAANQLNGGDPRPVIDFGYNRGQWTDIVLGIGVSADVRRGWLEVYLNDGTSDRVRAVPLFGGRTRVPRVLRWPDASIPAVPPLDVGGEPVRGGSHDLHTDLQIYRSPRVYDEVTLIHTAHAVGPTVESVDPRSYSIGMRVPET